MKKKAGNCTIYLDDGTQIKGKCFLYDLKEFTECESADAILQRAEVDRFDRLTQKGFRLNLITGKYDRRRAR